MTAALAASVGLHFMLVFSLPMLAQLWPGDEAEAPRLAVVPRERARLFLRLPDAPVRLRPIQAQKKRRAPRPVARASARPSPPAASSTGASSSQPGKAPALLILPEPAPIRNLSLPNLPSIMAWTEVPPPKPLEEVKAGERRPRARTRLPVADPSLRSPIPVPVTQSIPLPELARTSPKGLILPPSGSSPLRSPPSDLPPPDLPAAPALNLPGDNIAIISISAQTAAPGELVAIPNATVLPERDASGATGSGGRPGLRSHPGSTENGPSSSAAGKPGGTGSPGSGGTENGPPGAAGGKPGGTALPGPGGVAGGTDLTAHAAGAARGGNPLAALGPVLSTLPAHGGMISVRKTGDGSLQLSYPKGGSFDIVVIQSPDSDDEPDLRILRGSPVNTVYLNVGGPKEWILQYCLPPGAAPDARQSGAVVTMLSAPALVAPYVETVILPPTGLPEPPRRIVIRGRLGADGKFSQLVAVSGPAGMILPWLPRWEFRAAQSDGKPAAVEIVLLVPAAEAL